MEKESNTFESVWKALQEFGAKLEKSHAEADRRRAEADQRHAEARAEAEQRHAEAEQRRAEAEQRHAEALAEAEQRRAEARAEADQRHAEARAEAEQRHAEADKRRAEAEQRRVEADQRRAEADQRYAEAHAKAEKRQAEIDKEFKDLGEYLNQVSKRIDRVGDYVNQVSRQLGGIGNSNGDFAEEFFYNALLHGKRNILGEEFDDVMKSSKVTFNKGYEDEYDILLVNGRSVCIIEVKYKADSSDLPQQVLRKAQTFRVNFPRYNDKKVYLALAGMSFHPLTEKACQESGIAIMKQEGNAVAIYDEHLKAF